MHRLGLFRAAVALIVLAGAGIAAGASAPPAERGPEWVARRVREWQPTAQERAWEKIGWAKDLREAERLAREHRRPVFLFTHDGHLGVGRC
jgi:hypothetical protein